MKVITQVHEETGVKLGPQDFLISTLEQMADKLEESDRFASTSVTAAVSETTSETASAVAAKPTATPAVEEEKILSDINDLADGQDAKVSEVKETEAVEPKSETKKGVIRTLKGFWN